MKLRRTYWPAVLALLPVVLVHSSLRTLSELEQMKDVYLRNRSAAVAAKLETVSNSTREQIQELIEDEPGVREVEVISQSGDPRLEALWGGRELFRTESVNGVFRSWIPFHDGGRLRIARIDIDETSADFLLEHARHNVITATISGAVIVVLAAYALWAMRRSALEEKRRLELSHLAHLGKMSAVLAHEIRTPLATIKGFTQLALERGDRDFQAVLEPVVTETQRLERLVTDLLLYGRPPQPVIVDVAWEEVVAALRGISRVALIEDAAIRFRTDPNLLWHVLSNVLRNASDAVGKTDNGWVRVTAEVRARGELVIAVEDNGPGIPGDQRDKVFDSFFTTKSFGTGLGLPISRSLTGALGGSLVLSQRDAGGTRAEVRLPEAGARVCAAEVQT